MKKYPSGKLKAVTFSYDDGVEQDRRLVEILGRHGLKGTFNLNSGIQTGASAFEKNGVKIRRMNMARLPDLYAGHEIAVHSLTHPHLESLDEETIENELSRDKSNLERLFDCGVIGMVYPYGTYNDLVVSTARRCGLRYARAVESSYSFDIPSDLMTYHPTCHHNDARLLELAEQFMKLKPCAPQVFYLWGHSYEFDVDNNWHIIEEFCRIISGRDDIYYATGSEAFGLA